MNEKIQTKVFEDYPTIDCEDCERYHINQCDGVSEGSQRLCNQFLATRKVNTPLKIKELEKSLKTLHSLCIMNGICNVLLCIGVILQ